MRGYSASSRSRAARTADSGAVPANTRNRSVWIRSSSVSTAGVGPVVVPPPHAVAATNAEIAKSLRILEGQPVSVEELVDQFQQLCGFLARDPPDRAVLAHGDIA